jgi:N-acetylneuraminic acid mutarotase
MVVPSTGARRRHPGARIALVVLSLLATGALAGVPAQAAVPAEQAAPNRVAPQYRPAGCNTAEATTSTADGPLARCYALGLPTAGDGRQQKASGPPAGALGPADIRSAYRLPDGGEGQTVAIVGAFGYDAAEADLAVFRAHYGLPPCTTANGCFRKVDQSGGTNYPLEEPGWSIEAALDLDAVSAACPKCRILLVQADNNAMGNLGRAVDTAARLGAVAISNSYGVPGEAHYQHLYHAHYDHPGIAITVASGDIGNLQSFPATHPDVTAVGGTLLTRDSSPRGWSETAWEHAGSGCSSYEARPDYQAGIDTRCGDKRATADVSATAAPESGLAVYNTLGQDGWAQWGGTSLAAPLLAGMYALAGDPLPGTYPVTYPYRKDRAAGLTDVTTGVNGYCGNLLCAAGAGWDGPTGLGTPAGVSALTLGASGQLTGTVTAGRNTHGKKHGALSGVTVTATDSTGATFHATTDAQGRYRLPVPVGGYDVTAAAAGYRSAPVAKAMVGSGARVVRDLTLTAIPTRTLTGTVTDGSGHGWPLYAKITVDGRAETVRTDPYTGRYQVDLPVGGTYTVRATPVDLPGYVPGTATATIDAAKPGETGTVRRDLVLTADDTTCNATGYAWRHQGVATDFTGWSGQPKDGWQVTDETGSGQTWRFDDPAFKGNLTGGDGGFATVDTWSQSGDINSALVSPPADLTGVSAPVIGFDSDYSATNFGVQSADLELSLDGGAGWSVVRHFSDVSVSGHVEIAIPQAAGRSGVLVRFRYQGSLANWWQVDNVFVGTRACAAVPGGFIAGQVRDANTGRVLSGAKVSAGTGPAATTDGAGFYQVFVAGGGAVPVTATGLRYGDATATVRAVGDRVVRRDWSLRAGQLAVSRSSLPVSVRPGRTVTSEVRLTNTGDRPLRVGLVEQDRGYTPQAGGHRAAGPETPLVKVPVSDGTRSRDFVRSAATSRPGQSAADGTAWVELPELPEPLVENTVADNDGTVYSVGGNTYGRMMAEGFVYDPQARVWKPIAALPQPLMGAGGAFVDGKLYVVGGWDLTGEPLATTYAYDPMTDRWSRRADLPAAVADAATTTVDGKLYAVAGCPTYTCDTPSHRTYRYDPDTNRWTRLADYPLGVADHACGAAGNGLICVGGQFPYLKDSTGDAFRYFAESDTWVPTTGLNPLYGMAYATVGGRLRVIGGVTASTITNQVMEFDPATAVWSKLPNANRAVLGGGAACGTYQVGGQISRDALTGAAQQLPGAESCVRGADVSWLSARRTEITIPAGRTVTVTVTASAPAVAGHGVYTAQLAFETDTPYRTEPLAVVMTLR